MNATDTRRYAVIDCATLGAGFVSESERLMAGGAELVVVLLRGGSCHAYLDSASEALLHSMHDRAGLGGHRTDGPFQAGKIMPGNTDYYSLAVPHALADELSIALDALEDGYFD